MTFHTTVNGSEIHWQYQCHLPGPSVQARKGHFVLPLALLSRTSTPEQVDLSKNRALEHGTPAIPLGFMSSVASAITATPQVRICHVLSSPSTTLTERLARCKIGCGTFDLAHLCSLLVLDITRMLAIKGSLLWPGGVMFKVLRHHRTKPMTAKSVDFPAVQVTGFLTWILSLA